MPVTPKTVFIVSRGERMEGSTVIGVYADKDTACEVMKAHFKNYRWAHEKTESAPHNHPFYACVWDAEFDCDFVQVQEMTLRQKEQQADEKIDCHACGEAFDPHEGYHEKDGSIQCSYCPENL